MEKELYFEKNTSICLKLPAGKGPAFADLRFQPGVAH